MYYVIQTNHNTVSVFPETHTIRLRYGGDTVDTGVCIVTRIMKRYRINNRIASVFRAYLPGRISWAVFYILRSNTV